MQIDRRRLCNGYDDTSVKTQPAHGSGGGQPPMEQSCKLTFAHYKFLFIDNRDKFILLQVDLFVLSMHKINREERET